MEYVETKIFKSTQKEIKKRTKIDIVQILAACVAVHKASKTIPDLMATILDSVKERATSSMRIGVENSRSYKGILGLVARKSSSDCSWWLKFGGQHDYLSADGTITPLPNQADRFFWHDKTLFSLEVSGPKTLVHSYNDPDDDDDQYAGGWNDNNYSDQEQGYLIIRCFGGSHAPIEKLLADIDDELIKNKKLRVTKMMADTDDKTILRHKRPLATIDLDPGILEKTSKDVELFFHKSTPGFCRDTGTPHRRGYLLYGPPRTGKSSLSAAIPSHVNVDLVTITLHGMDDKMLEEAFSRLPYRCVVLIEDIDCAGAEVGQRSYKASKDSLKPDEEADARIDTHEAVEVIKQTMEAFIQRQEHHNEAILQLMT
jgi:chaperone BCS1